MESTYTRSRTGVDLDAYFRRIGYYGTPAATPDTLRELHRLHAQTIPFENFDYLLRRPISIDISDLQRKLVGQGRGGGCYEQNLLFGEVLRAIGFEVKGIIARVRWQVPEAVVTARIHRLNLVRAGDELYTADVGFIGMTPSAPIRLQPDCEQQTPHETFRVVRAAEDFVLQVKIQGVWRPVYQVSFDEQLPPDDEQQSWYHANHPGSFVCHDLIAAIVRPGCRYVLHNTRFTEYYLDGTIERKRITSAAAARDTLRNVFGLDVPPALDMEALMQRLLQPKA